MRFLAAIVLAGCSFQPRAAAPADTGGAADASSASDAPLDAEVTTADAPPDGAIVTHPPGWWSSAWSSRMQLTIANSAATAMAQGYQVGLELDLDAAPCAGSAAPSGRGSRCRRRWRGATPTRSRSPTRTRPRSAR